MPDYPNPPRRCPRCGSDGPYYKDKTRKDGLFPWCAECQREVAREREAVKHADYRAVKEAAYATASARDGLCECGCGRKTSLATTTDLKVARVKGYPQRYVLGHGGRSPDEKFEEDPATGCWNWTGHKAKAGYGIVRWDNRTYRAHRFIYEREVGPIPDDHALHHECRNTSCVNPAHLTPLTFSEHMSLHNAERQ